MKTISCVSLQSCLTYWTVSPTVVTITCQLVNVRQLIIVLFGDCQLTDESILKTACEDHQLCVIAVLPHILDCQSDCRKDYLSLMRRLGEKHKKRMWG